MPQPPLLHPGWAGKGKPLDVSSFCTFPWTQHIFLRGHCLQGDKAAGWDSGSGILPGGEIPPALRQIQAGENTQRFHLVPGQVRELLKATPRNEFLGELLWKQILAPILKGCVQEF